MENDDTLVDHMIVTALLALSLAAPPSAAVRAGECVVVAPVDGGVERAFGGDECDRRTLPASTFKIPHALIALDSGVVTATSVMKWDGKARDYPTWNRDHTLESAIRNSVVWFFQSLARSIGRDREIAHLRAFGYGSQMFAGAVDEFWLNGDLTISPREQVQFLERMFSDRLPVERRHVDTVKAAMTMPPGRFTNAMGEFPFRLSAWPADVVARLKTGNGTVAGERVSWMIGEIDSGGRAYVFASRVRTADDLATTAGADLAVRILNTVAPQR